MKVDKRILMIINEFPPTGESGVQRPLKFLKYLDRAGWTCWVVTPQKPPKNVLDHSLDKDIPASANIHKTMSLGIPAKKLEKVEELRQELLLSGTGIKAILWKLLKIPNDLLMPIDKQIGWVPFALFKSIRLIQKHKLCNVYITAFPFSAFLIGLALKRIYKKRIFWVADYRDAWQFAPRIEANVLPFRKNLIDRVDDSVIRACDKAVFVTDFIMNQYAVKHPEYASKLHMITNGFDDDDFAGIHPKDFETATILYMGKVSPRMAKGMIALLKAVEKSCSTSTQVIHIGTTCPEIKDLVTQSKYEFFHFEGYKQHREALEYAAGADINIILMNDDKEAEGVYTGKLFELIRLGRPILFIGPQKTIVRDVLESTKLGLCAFIGSENDIIEKLNQLRIGANSQEPQRQTIARFSRINLTQQLIDLYWHKNGQVQDDIGKDG